MADKIAEILLKINAVVLRPKEPFKWASGILSPIYTDNRLLMSYPGEREEVIDFFVNMIHENRIDFYGFAGTATAGIPWASWLAQKMKRPMVYVRSSAKDHGKENLIEGRIEEGKKYVVVEDLVSTGGSSITTINALRDANAIVEYCIAIFTYELEKAKNNFENASVKLHSLSNFTNLAKTAVDNKYITEEELNHIMEWKKNPEKWISK